MHLPLNELFTAAQAIVRRAGETLGNAAMAADIRAKGPTDFVTAVDVQVQREILAGLHALDDTVQLMGEEQDNSHLDMQRPVWILDPVDGTTNLIHAYRHSAISLALAVGGESVLAIVYDPFAGEMFTAQKGCGAFLNGVPMHVSSVPALSAALCSVGTNPGERDGADAAFARMRALYDCCHDIRRMGSAALDLCYVACGRQDAYVEHSLKPWDYAAGMLLVKEAGGTVTTFAGGEVPLHVKKSTVAAGNGLFHRQLLALV